MTTNQDWSIEWVTYFDQYAGDFHPTFRHKLAKQLFEKGSIETGIRGFDKYNFQLLIGQEDVRLQQMENYMFALASFCTPSAIAYYVWICWKAKDVDLDNLHTKDVSLIDIEFHWGNRFPKEEILSELRPFKKERKDKSNLHFDIEYYHNAFPDIILELIFEKQPHDNQVEHIDNFLKTFLNEWNHQNRDKAINYLSPLVKQNESIYEMVGDFGVHNSIKTIGKLLKELSGEVQPGIISKIMVK